MPDLGRELRRIEIPGAEATDHGVLHAINTGRAPDGDPTSHEPTMPEEVRP